MNLLGYIKEKKWRINSPNKYNMLSLIFENIEDANEELMYLIKKFSTRNISGASISTVTHQYYNAKDNEGYVKRIIMKLNITTNNITMFEIEYVPENYLKNENWYYNNFGLKEINFISKENKFINLIIGE